MKAVLALTVVYTVGALDKPFDSRIGVLYQADRPKHEAEGLLRAEHPRHHVRFMNLLETMDPLENRRIDAISDQKTMVDEINYLRSHAVEECRALVCSSQGKARFSECADSLLSTDKKCRPACQDHLMMWVLHGCYLVETFDCEGNIGLHSLNPAQLSFNQDGPQTLAEFTTSVKNAFDSKGVNCECCEFADVTVMRESASPEPASMWSRLISFLR